MRHNKFIVFLLLCGIISSCDTREDYFFNHSEEPIITLNSTADSTIDGKRYIFVELSWGDTVEIDYNFDDPYGQITDFHTEIKARINNRPDGYYWGDNAVEIVYDEDGYPDHWAINDHKPEFDFTHFANKLSVEIDTNRNKILIIEKTTNYKKYYDFRDRTHVGLDEDSLAINAIITISAANALGKFGSSNILMSLYGNRPPKSDFHLLEVNGHELHREIVTDCIDPDGDKIIGYEYCIDGVIINNRSGYAYEEGPVKDEGKGAYNGTYITYTKQSSIKHAFQEKGDHTIHVRCKDRWGDWSTWTSKTIYIE